jgi:hypothetical protein
MSTPSVVPMPSRTTGYTQSAARWEQRECPACGNQNAMAERWGNILRCPNRSCRFYSAHIEASPAPGAAPNGHASDSLEDILASADGAPKQEHPRAEERNHNLDAALGLAVAGLRIFPVRVYYAKEKKKWEKVPRIEGWREEAASTNPNQIREWWKQFPGSCPGIALHHADLVAVDADKHRASADGVAALKELQAKYKEFPKHPVCATAGDGEHHYFRQPPGIKLTNSAGRLPPGIDVRGVGGFVIAPGSKRADGKLWSAPGFVTAYKAGDIPIIPDWLFAQIHSPEQKTQTNGGAVPHDDRIEAPADELANVKAALPFIPADDRNRTWFKIGAALHSTRWSCRRELWDDWSKTCLAKFDAADQDKTWRSFDRPRKGKPITIATLFDLAKQYGWEHPGRSAQQEDGADAILEMNSRYCVVNDSGSVLVFRDRYDEIMGRRIYDRMTAAAFKLLHKNETAIVKGEDGATEKKPVADVWLSHRRRRTYQAVVFDPSEKAGAGVLNLWRGFGFKPQPGDWSKLKAHILDNVCTGDDLHFAYLISWMALLVQKPAEQGQVAIIMRGKRGVGKGILGHILRRIFGQHGMYVSKSKHLVGAFNSHLRDCVLLFADEAFFAGDRAAEGTLKSLITEDTLTIEPKGQNVILCRNRLHIIMASNEDWVVPAGLDERRYFMLDVGEERKQDLAYFAGIMEQMDNGGCAALLHELLNHDVSKFQVRKVPDTDALDDQKKRSLKTEVAWLHEVLARGYVYRSKLGLTDEFNRWIEWVSTDLLHASYLDYANQ